MTYNFKSKRHVNWPTACRCQTLHQDSSNRSFTLCKGEMCSLSQLLLCSYTPSSLLKRSQIKSMDGSCSCQWHFVQSFCLADELNSFWKTCLFSAKRNKIKLPCSCYTGLTDGQNEVLYVTQHRTKSFPSPKNNLLAIRPLYYANLGEIRSCW